MLHFLTLCPKVVRIVTTVVYRIGEQCLSDSSNVQGTVYAFFFVCL
jgi:chromate transport protein ChrA